MVVLDIIVSIAINRVEVSVKVSHGIRVALAFVCTFLIVRALGIPDRSWPLITLIVVFVPSDDFRGTLLKALNRVGGTLIGAAVGLVALWAESFCMPLMVIVMAFGAYLCGYFYHSKHSYGALIIGVTMAVVVNAPIGDFKTALMRVTCILIGCLIANMFRGIFSIAESIPRGKRK